MTQGALCVPRSQELSDLSADVGSGAGRGGCGERGGEKRGEREVDGGVGVEGVDVNCAVVYRGHFGGYAFVVCGMVS